MSQENLIKLECTVCKNRTYYTYKNIKKLRGHRLELKKHCEFCNKHTLQKESK